MKNEPKGKVKGGLARAASLTSEQRSEIAQKAATARWSINEGEMPEALREGRLAIGEVTLDCYVLKDRRRLFHKRGLAKGLGMKSEGGNVFMRTINRKGLGSEIPPELRQKIDNPIIFKPLTGDPAHGYESTVLIDLCNAILVAKQKDKLEPSQYFLALQAEIILRSSAKVGITALIDEATGYIKDKHKEEYRELFREFIREECREWEREFPDQLFDMIYRLYNIRRNADNTKRLKFFGKFLRKYIYFPIANSNGAILEMLDEKNPVVYKSGGRRYKLFQFLSDVVGLPVLRAHIWQIIGIGNATRTKEAFDKGFKRAFPGSQRYLPGFEDFDDEF